MPKVKSKKYEVEMTECGHEVPLEFIVYDVEGCGTCMKCYAENLTVLLISEKKKNKKLRAKLKTK